CYASHPNPNTRQNQYAGARGAAEAAAFAAGVHVSLDDWEAERAGQRKQNAALLREVVGNPFRPVTLDPAWLSPTALALARTIYRQRTFAGLPVRADALLDAGCASTDLVAHCRSDGPHVRGCFAVDLILGKE